MTDLNNMGRAGLALKQIAGYGTPNDHLSRAAPANLDENDKELVDQWARDLLCDLRHLCDAIGFDFETWNERSYDCYREEREEEDEEAARLARIPTTQQIHDALTRAPALNVQTWNTGGGTMVTYVIVETKGSPVTVNGVKTGELSASKYIGITHEDEFVICYTDDLFDEGAEYEVRHNLPAYDLDAMVDFVGGMTLAAKVFDLSRILEPLVKREVNR